jgi:uncharacterized protein (TIGR00251 family)
MLHQTRDGVTLAVRAQPGAKKTAITGVYGEGAQARLKIAVSAPPIDGRANESLAAFLAQVFSLPTRGVEIVAGPASRSKVFLLSGATMAQVEAALKAVLKS